MNLRNRTSLACPSGFTLVEVLVASTILLVILLLLVQTTNAVRRTWSRTTETAEEFRESREAFEAMRRRISQATLNTYWDYDSPTKPTKYFRQSELRFTSGLMEDLAGSSNPKRPGHGIFFQAPIGFVVDPQYEELENLLNTWGFYVEWGSDKSSWPPFIQSLQPAPEEKWRFRLMELMEPSEDLTIYKETSGFAKAGRGQEPEPKNSKYSGKNWFTDPLKSTNPKRTRAIADNILYITLRPQEQIVEAKRDLTTNFYYDSGPGGTDPRWRSQLPQILILSMMAVEENSFARIQGSDNSAPKWMDGRWRNVTKVDDDQKAIEEALNQKNIKYRVYNTRIAIPGAKWTEEIWK